MEYDLDNASHTLQDEVGEEGTPVCLRCLRPTDPLVHYCPHCGEAIGRFTTYIPFVDIRWYTGVYGKMWRQAWSGDISIVGRIIRFMVIVMFAPVMLIGVIPKLWCLIKKVMRQNVDEPEKRDGSTDV